MSTTTQYRYEVGCDDYGVITHARTMQEAKQYAQNWLEREKIEPYIYDRMAHKNKPKLYTVKACTGAAHSNPLIDNCGVCMPDWGIVVRPAEVQNAA